MNRFWQNTFTFWLFFFIILFIYQKTFETPFIFDDTINISENYAIRMQNFSYAAIKKAILASHSLSRPVANVSFALNYYFHQYRVWGYHATNLAIHILTGFFLFLLFKRTLILTSESNPQEPSGCMRIYWASVFAALIWLTHPMQTQSVTYIVQRMNSMAGMFFVASMLLYGYARSVKSPLLRMGLWGGVLLTALMAFGTKLNTVTLPFFMLLYECFFYRNLDWAWGKRVIGIFIGVLVLLASAVLLIFSINPLTALLNTYQGYAFTPLQRVMTELRVIIFYLFQLAWPHPGRLNLDHDFPLSQSLIDPLTTLLSLVAILLALGIAVYQARRSRLLAFSIIWYFGNLVIESSIIGLGLIYDHRVYLPSMFPLLAVVDLGAKHIKSVRFAVILGGGIVFLFSFWTYERNQDWQSGIAIWRDAMEKSPQKARPYYSIGVLLYEKGAYNVSLTFYRKALTLDPNYFEAHNNLGNIFRKLGKIDEAIKHYQKALEIYPNSSLAHNNIGVVLVEGQGKIEEGVKHFQKALQIDSNCSNAYNNLGLVSQRQGKLDEAINRYYKALDIDSNNFLAHYNLGNTLQEQGKLDAAIKHYHRALDIDPNNPIIHLKLGITLGKQEEFDEAIKHYTMAINKDSNCSIAYNQIGNTLFRLGKLENAIEYYQKAFEIDKRNMETHDDDKRKLNIHPQFIQALNRLALISAHQKNYIQSVLYLKKIITFSPDIEDTYYNIACYYSLDNNVEESLFWLKKAIIKGFNDWDLIKTDKKLENIRCSSFYKGIIDMHNMP